MKNITLALATGLFLLLCAPVFASWNDDIVAAINAKNYPKIDQIAAANQSAQGDIAFFLLQQAAGKAAGGGGVSSDLCAAGDVLASVVALASQISEDKKQQAAGIISTLGSQAGGAQASDSCAQKIVTEIAELDKDPLLAQQPGVTPTITNQGAINPSAE